MPETTTCPVCKAIGGLHIMPCHRYRLLICIQQSGCDGVSHDIRCNDVYYRRKARA